MSGLSFGLACMLLMLVCLALGGGGVGVARYFLYGALVPGP